MIQQTTELMKPVLVSLVHEKRVRVQKKYRSALETDDSLVRIGNTHIRMSANGYTLYLHTNASF
jgi:hypothetical protein